jgi:hypothetical protein
MCASALESMDVGTTKGIQGASREFVHVADKHNESSTKAMRRFPKSVQNYVVGMSRIATAEFGATFDMGGPPDQLKQGDKDILLLYTESALPTNTQAAADITNANTPIPLLPAVDALEECAELHVILADHKKSDRNICTAFVPQYESFHVHKWMRVKGQFDKSNHSLPFKYVSRGREANGANHFQPPLPSTTRKLWKILHPYIGSVDETLATLRPFVEKVAKNKQLVVMVCNMGQSELLMNFVCSSKARGLDTSQVLVFATDMETKALAESLGLTTFYDEVVSSSEI